MIGFPCDKPAELAPDSRVIGVRNLRPGKNPLMVYGPRIDKEQAIRRDGAFYG
jgi:hypothetical protein